MTNIEIIPVCYAKSTLPESMVFQGGSKDKTYPIVFNLYLLKTEGKLILIDAGCETLPGFVMTDFVGSVKALENNGYFTDDITDVIITHAHHDHIECAKYFKNSIIHIQKDEFESGKTFLPDYLNLNVFDDFFEVCEGVKIVKIGGHTKGSCVVEIGENTVAVGDECYIKECIEKQIPTGVSYCLEKSKAFIHDYKDKNLLFAHSKNMCENH